MKRLRGIILFVAVFLLTTGFQYSEDKQRVFDYAQLLMTSEAQEAEDVLKKQSLEDKVDYAFVSTDDLEGYSAKGYMDAFITTNQIGYNNVDGDSAILLVDLKNKEVWVGTGGTLSTLFQDTDISNIVSDILPYTQRNDFHGAIQVFAHNIHSRLEAKNTKTNPSSIPKDESIQEDDDEVNNDKLTDNLENDEEYSEQSGGLFSNPFTCLFIGAVLAGIVVFVMIQSGKSSMQASADTYTTEARVNPYTKQDIFLRTVTSKTKREKPKKD